MTSRTSSLSPCWAPAVLLIAVNSPNILLVLKSQDLHLLSVLLIPALIITTALYAVFPRAVLWFIAPLIPVSLLESLYVLRYERVTDEHILSIVGETDAREALAWLGPSGWAVLAFGFAGVLLAISIARKYALKPVLLPGRWRFILALVALLTLALLHLPSLAEPRDDLLHTTRMEDAALLGTPWSHSLSEVFPWGVPLRFERYLALQQGMRDARQRLAEFRFGAHQVPPREEEEVYVLVIGETGRPDRWSLNGYERRTTPRLEKVPGVVGFTDAITGWAWTRMSVPVIVTRKSPDLASSFFPERSIVSAFREAGFWTAWYSMHGALGFHESAVALYANEADDVRFLNPAGYRSPGAYDEVLLVELDKALARPERKKFIVLHALGSHFNYAHRYPEKFDVFQPSLKNRTDADLYDRRQREALGNSYDNSILYTDHVLAGIIERILATGQLATMLYISDHGENLFDGECGKSGHGHQSDFDFRTAALWWNSAKFAHLYPQKAANIAMRRSVSWSTSNVFHTLLDSAGIDFPGNVPENSLLNANYIPRPRWTQAGVYFDDAERDPLCATLKPKSLMLTDVN